MAGGRVLGLGYIVGQLHLFGYGAPSSPHSTRSHLFQGLTALSFPYQTRLPSSSSSSCPLCPHLFAITDSSPTGPVLIPQRRSHYPCYTTEGGKKPREIIFAGVGGELGHYYRDYLDYRGCVWEGDRTSLTWCSRAGKLDPTPLSPLWFHSKSSGRLT